MPVCEYAIKYQLKMPLKTFKYRLYPTPAQEQQLGLYLDGARHWYNMCVAERKYAYELEGRRVKLYEQLRLVKCYKAAIRQLSGLHSHVFQVATTDCDKAFRAFFRRVEAGERPGYPRFKGSQRFGSFGLKQYGNGFKVDGHRLKVSGVGRIAVRWHRPLEGAIKTVRLVRRAGRWYACFACEVAEAEPLPASHRVVGIDVGICALLTTSDGEKVENPSYYRAAQRRLRRTQRKLARARRGSHRRRCCLRAVQRQQEHVANQRRDFLHKLSTHLIRSYDGLALEDLRVHNMVKNHHLSKSILDSGWSAFGQYLAYKAANAGRQVALVDPAYTSRTCSCCGAVFQDFDLATRWVTCACGLSLDRDHNAAINILRRAGWDTPVQLNVEERVSCVL